MEELTLEHFYAQSLGLQSPWRVAKVVIDGESREVRIRVECAVGEAWADPETSDGEVTRETVGVPTRCRDSRNA
jgi:hypothetical protein